MGACSRSEEVGGPGRAGQSGLGHGKPGAPSSGIWPLFVLVNFWPATPEGHPNHPVDSGGKAWEARIAKGKDDGKP